MDDLSKSVVSSIAVVRDKANAFITKRLAAHGLSNIAPAHGSVFYCFFEGNELTMSDIATRINRDKSTVTALVDKLVVLGYAEKRKSASDGRVTRVRLTEDGLALRPVFDEISDELLAILYQGFSPEEQYIFVRLAQRMIGNLSDEALTRDIS
jgi:DNA-binding MarR family transcriptional regulator